MARRLFKTILVAVEFPNERRQSGLAKAAELARRLGARLILVHCAFHPYAQPPGLHNAIFEQGIEKSLAARGSALERLARPLRRRGLKVTVRLLWDYPAFEGIVREVLRSKPDLVVAESKRHAFGARLFLANNDWQLILNCPAPLLLVKKASIYGKARVLAAIDPLHVHARSGQLDKRILELAQALTTALAGRLDVVHAYLPISSLAIAAVGETVVVPVDPQIERRYALDAKRAVDRVALPLKLPHRQLHVEPGQPEFLIRNLAKRLHADMVVMGAVSRRGLKRVFIGNTAERVLDALRCDLLVVKPAGFKTRVAKRPTPGRLLLATL